MSPKVTDKIGWKYNFFKKTIDDNNGNFLSGGGGCGALRDKTIR